MAAPPSYGSTPKTWDRDYGSEVLDYSGPEEWIHTILPSKSQEAARLESKPRTRKTILLGLGMLVVFNLLVIPVWNCLALLRDPVFMFMTGSETTQWLLGCCTLFFVICYLTLLIFLNRTEREARSEQSLIMISCIFLSTLGIVLILFGGPLKRDAQEARLEFTTNCKLGARTSQLFIAQEKLQSLRAVPSCAKLDSVEECDHFEAFPQQREAMVLKEMEIEYQCSGICAGTDAQGQHIFRPTLFSNADHKVSCDGMAARRLRNFAGDVSNQTFTQGVWLLVAAIFISFGQLIGFCTSGGKPEKDLA